MCTYPFCCGRTWRSWLKSLVVLGVTTALLAGCGTSVLSPLDGDKPPGLGGGGANGTASAGQTLFNQRCAGCHSSAASLAGAASRITTDLGTVSSAMTGVTLTTQQVADLKAYLATLLPGGGGPGNGGAGLGTASASAGQTTFNFVCAGCHTAASIAPFASRIATDLGKVAPAMAGLTLTAQQVADLQAYLATLSSGSGSGGGGGGSGSGSASAGQTLFSQSCAGCHSAASLAPFASSITTNLGTVASAMNGITLTTQQVADLQAYLATLSSGGGTGGGGGGSGTGSASAGQTLFSQSCAGCHSAASLAPFASSITTDLGTVASAMNGITLTTQQVADLQAYLATLASGGGGSGDSDGDDDGD